MARLAVVFFVVLVGSSACKNREKNSFFTRLEHCGVRYDLPSGWTVYDPPMKGEAIPGGDVFSNLGEQGAPFAVFVTPDKTIVKIACSGPIVGAEAQDAERQRGMLTWVSGESVTAGQPLLQSSQVQPTTMADGTTTPLTELRFRDEVRVIAGAALPKAYLVIAASSSTPEQFKLEEVTNFVKHLRPL